MSFDEYFNLLSFVDAAEPDGGAWRYEEHPLLFSGRSGVGPLRVAWDTNVLIDYGQFDIESLIFGEGNWPAVNEAYLKELKALADFVHMWMMRDIRIHVFDSQLDDAKRALREGRRSERATQLAQIQSALACLDQRSQRSPESDKYPLQLDFLPEGYDKTIFEETYRDGCHVLLTRDEGLLRGAHAATKFGVVLAAPTDLMAYLDDTDENLMSGVGPFVMPDTHKWQHLSAACGVSA